MTDAYRALKKSLGISSRRLVHHWGKAGAPGQIPGYATHELSYREATALFDLRTANQASIWER